MASHEGAAGVHLIPDEAVPVSMRRASPPAVHRRKDVFNGSPTGGVTHYEGGQVRSQPVSPVGRGAPRRYNPEHANSQPLTVQRRQSANLVQQPQGQFPQGQFPNGQGAQGSGGGQGQGQGQFPREYATSPVVSEAPQNYSLRQAPSALSYQNASQNGSQRGGSVRSLQTSLPRGGGVAGGVGGMRQQQPLQPPSVAGGSSAVSVRQYPLSDAQLERNIADRVAVLNRVGKMLRRKVGHEREDKAYDSLMRAKTIHIIFFSMTGLVSMIVGACVTWYTGEFRTDTRWKNANPTIKTIMLCLQIVCTLTTLVTILLIVQFYRLLLLNKRREWMGHTDIDDDTLDTSPLSIKGSYSFWKSSWLRASFTLEILAHIVHPIFLMQDLAYTLFTLCQIFMFLRLYLFVRALHTFSRAYKLRIEIINSNRDFQTMNLRIKMNLTLKMLFYSRTTLVLSGSFFAVIMVFSFMIFLVERDEQRNAFGRLENVMWFSFITFTTIGFGDFVPSTVPGRLLTVLLGVSGVIITTIFSGVLTNKLVPTKIQRYVVEYLQVRRTSEAYRQAAARLIQCAFRTYIRSRRSIRVGRVSHKANRVYGAVKDFRRARFDVKGAVLPSTDPVLEEKMVVTKKYLKSLDDKLTVQHELMLGLQSKIEDELASILRALK